jgi:hypothetical protein
LSGAAGFLRAEPLSRFRRSEILLLTELGKDKHSKLFYKDKTAHITKDAENINEKSFHKSI